MNTNQTLQTSNEDDLTVLGIASVDTQGAPLVGEDIGGPNIPGIAEE